MSKQKIIVAFFFLFYLLLGLFIVRDYGISYDEPTERHTSHWNYKFVVSKIYNILGNESQLIGNLDYNRQMLHHYPDRYYGTFLHWPLVGLEHLTEFTLDSQEVYLSRHINTFLYFYLAVICLYFLLKKRLKSWKLALLGSIILVTTPRFFAEAFYNNKDILFFACYFISIYFSTLFFEKKSWVRAIILGIIMGIAINTRIIAAIILVLVSVWGFVEILQLKKKRARFNLGLKILLINALALGVYILTTPVAWGNETAFLIEVWQQFSHYNWQGQTLYLGSLVNWNEIPWHYIPVYLWATIPIWYGLLFVLGLGKYIGQIKTAAKKRKHIWQDKNIKQDVFIFLTMIIPLILVILVKSTLYNGWRHLYFIYGPFVYFVALGLLAYPRFKKTLLAISFAVIGINILWVGKNHPYQFMYFNPLIRSKAHQLFERDYWAVTSLDLAKYILITDQSSNIKIAREDYLARVINLMLNRQDKDKFELINDKSQADYISKWYYNDSSNSYDQDGFTEIYSISVDGMKTMSLYKNNDLE